MPTPQSSQPVAAKPISSLRSGLAVAGARLGELRRAAIVFEIYALAERNPKLGKQAIINTVFLSHLNEPGISERSLWRWVAAFERGGLAAIADHKAGRSGRKAKGQA